MPGNGSGPKVWRRVGLTIQDESGPAFRISDEPLEAGLVKMLRYVAEAYNVDVKALARQASGENGVKNLALSILVAVPAFALLVFWF